MKRLFFDRKGQTLVPILVAAFLDIVTTNTLRIFKIVQVEALCKFSIYYDLYVLRRQV
jgi:hypothetical protein